MVEISRGKREFEALQALEFLVFFFVRVRQVIIIGMMFVL